MPESPSFVFFTCQIGAEPALKQELAREWPGLRFAYSRPGFLTFKLDSKLQLPDNFADRLVFARASGFCLGKTTGTTTAKRAESIWKLIGDRPVTDLHVWPRDKYSPGFRAYEPGMTPETVEVERLIREAGKDRLQSAAAIDDLDTPPTTAKSHGKGTSGGASPRKSARVDGPLIADVVIVDESEWWVGYHRVHSLVSVWPGGFLQASLPAEAVSRAWLKIHEALLWSGFHLKPGQTCVEIGSAPGGAAQFLLARGLDVIGVDPAKMDPVVLANPHFRHILKRSKEVPRREFVGVDWLTCDINLPPNYTLDAVKAIVMHPGVRFKGMLLTLKLVEWSLAEEIPKFLEKIRLWGYPTVRARQLHHNRQEICVAASRPPSRRRIEPRKKARAQVIDE
jgi:23S rRNA (cytidine2498-2'-O)-methyltransferase